MSKPIPGAGSIDSEEGRAARTLASDPRLKWFGIGQVWCEIVKTAARGVVEAGHATPRRRADQQV